ncbi:hypothetical protein JCM3770_006421 [Rhodotorula araucariae]
MRRRLPCLARLACPSAPAPPQPSRAAHTAAAGAAVCAPAQPARTPLAAGAAGLRTALNAAGTLGDGVRRRTDNFPQPDTAAHAGRTGADGTQEQRSVPQGGRATLAGTLGALAELPVASTSGGAAPAWTATQNAPERNGDNATFSTSKSRRRPAAVTAQVDYAPSRIRSPLPSADSLLAQPLPDSEPALYAFLRCAQNSHPNVPPSWLAWFHAHPRIALFASTRTYRLLLHRATTATDKGLVRALLSEMGERGVPLDDETRRVLLRGFIRGGEDAHALEVLRALGRGARGAPLKATKPRDLGAGARGHGDAQAKWKGWATRERDKLAEEARRREMGQPQIGAHGVARGTYKRRRLRPVAQVAPVLPTSAHWRPILVPSRPGTLSSSDITTIVECLVQERRHDEAFALADTWLSAKRPGPDDASPPVRSHPIHFDLATVSLARQRSPVADYNDTALVLLNILVKSLFYERPSRSAIRTFVDAFLSKHSAPAPAAPLVPNIVTLRQLVSSCLGSVDAWTRATSLVDWYGYRFGLPAPSGHPRAPRQHFAPPSHVEGARLGVEGPGRGAAASASTGRALLLIPPHAAVSPDVAVLLLRHAVDQHARGTLGYAARVRAVRRWWAGFDRRGSDVWTYWKTRELVKRAVRIGLLEDRSKRRRRPQEPEG